MCKQWLVALLFLSSFMGHAAPIDSEYDTSTRYDYLYVNVGSGSFDGDIGTHSNVTSWHLGGNTLLTENWLLTVDYSARFVNPSDYELRIDTLLAGGGYRFNLAQNLDLVMGAQIGALKAKATVKATDKTLYSDSEFVYAGSLTFNYAFTEKTEGSVVGKINRSDWMDENIAHVEVNHYVTPRISLGGFYTYRKADVHFTNEAGVSFRVIY